MYIPKFDDYLKILADNKRKDFAGINFGEYFKSTKEKLCSKINEEKNPRKFVESLYIFVTKQKNTES